MVAAFLLGLVLYFIFYYTPTNLTGLIQRFTPMPPQAEEIVEEVLAQFLPPELLLTGLLLTFFIPLGVILGGTKAHGPLIVVVGGLFAFYLYTLLHGGFITVPLPRGLPFELRGEVVLEIPLFTNLLLIPPLLTMVKGALVTAKSFRGA